MKTRLLVFLLLATFGCSPEDFDLPAWQAQFLVPIIDADFDASDITFTDLEVDEDSSGLIIFSYEASQSRSLEELFPLDDESVDFTIPGIPGDVPDFQVDIPLESEALGIPIGFFPQLDPLEKNKEIIVDISEYFLLAEFEKGALSLDLANQFPFTILPGLTLGLFNSDDSVALISFNTSQPLAPGEAISFPAQMINGLTLEGDFTLKMDNFATNGGANLTIEAEDALVMGLSFTDITYARAVVRPVDFSFPVIEVAVPVDIGFGAMLQKVSLDSAVLGLNIPELNLEVFSFDLTLISATQNGVPLSFSLNPGETSVDLANLDLDLTLSDPPYNQILVRLQMEVNSTEENVEIFFNRPLDGEISVTSIDFDVLEGYLGTGTEILENQVEVDLFSRIRGGEFLFKDPRIILEINNSQGFQVTMQNDGQGLYVRGSNPILFGDQEVAIGEALDGFTIQAAPQQGEKSLSVLQLNEVTEPAFNDFMGVFPTRIDVRIPVFWGTTTPDFDQFLLVDEPIDLYTRLELPMEFSARNLVLADTVDYTTTSNFDQVEVTSATFSTVVTSLFPFQIHVQTYFLDANQALLDSLFSDDRIVQPAEFGPDGEVTAPMSVQFDVEVSPEKLVRIQSAAFAVPHLTLITPDDRYVKLLSSYKANVKITGDILLNVDLN